MVGVSGDLTAGQPADHVEGGGPLLTTAEAAEYLGVGPSTMEKWRLTGEGPEFEKIGPKFVRYTHAKLDAYRHARRFKSTSEYSPAHATRPPPRSRGRRRAG